MRASDKPEASKWSHGSHRDVSPAGPLIKSIKTRSKRLKTVPVYTAEYREVMDIPRSRITHMPSGMRRFILCPFHDSECQWGDQCRYIHADVTGVPARNVHVNNRWRSLEEVPYERFPAGRWLKIHAPNRAKVEVVLSEMLLKTKVFDREILDSRDNTFPRDVDQRIVAACAHFHLTKRTCALAADCHFAHVVYIDPQAKSHQQAPPLSDTLDDSDIFCRRPATTDPDLHVNTTMAPASPFHSLDGHRNLADPQRHYVTVPAPPLQTIAYHPQIAVPVYPVGSHSHSGRTGPNLSNPPFTHPHLPITQQHSVMEPSGHWARMQTHRHDEMYRERQLVVNRPIAYSPGPSASFHTHHVHGAGHGVAQYQNIPPSLTERSNDVVQTVVRLYPVQSQRHQ